MRLFRWVPVLLFLLSTEVYSQPIQVITDTLLIKRKLGEILQFEVDSGHTDRVRLILDQGVSPNFTNGAGITPLMYAVQRNYYEIAQMLLEAGADPDVLPDNGFAALHTATVIGSDSLVILLIKHNADVNITNFRGVTPLHLAVWYGFPYITNILLLNGAHIDIPDNSQSTPLMYGVYAGAVLSSRLLLERGADPNCPDVDGITPLMVAAQFNDTAMVNLLIEFGARLDPVSSTGADAMCYAIKYGSMEVLKILLQHGAADLNPPKPYNQIAREAGRAELIPLLNRYGIDAPFRPAISLLGLGTRFIFNNHDFMLGVNLMLKEALTNIMVSFDYRFRPTAIATLRLEGNELFQYWEYKHTLSINIERFQLIRPFYRSKFGVIYGVGGNYVMSTFEGAKKRSDSNFHLTLNSRACLNVGDVQYYIGLRYRLKSFEGVSPLLYEIGVGYRFGLGKPRIKEKRIRDVL